MKTSPHSSAFKSQARPARAAGFTLIEMLISITIGLGILAGLVGVLATNASNSRANDRTSELMTNGRYALNSIRQEIRQAGFRGYTWADPAAPTALVVNGCVGAEGGASVELFVSNLRQGVWGANDANPFAASCIAPANYAANTDVLVVRRLAAIPAAGLIADTVYFQSSYERGQVFQGAVAPVFTGPATPLARFALQVHVYYIRPWTVSAAEVPLLPALVRVSLDSTGNMVSELVASGIERMQVQYGWLPINLNTQYFDAGQGPFNTSSSDATAVGSWDEVNAVRIWLLARNATPEPGYVNTTVYPMGDQPFTANDNFRRQLFSTVVQLRN